MAKKTAPKKGKLGKRPTQQKPSRSSRPERRAASKKSKTSISRSVPVRRRMGRYAAAPSASAKAELKLADPRAPMEDAKPAVPASETALVQPTRAPRRRIIGEDVSKAAPVGEVGETAQAAEPATAPETAKLPPSAEPELRIETSGEPLPFVNWNDIPPGYPSFAQSYFSLALLECERAARWPFAFARFIAELPKTCSASQFLVCMLALELEIDAIAKLVGLELGDVLQLQKSGEETIQSGFAKTCPELERQWSIVLSGPGPKNDNMLERYYVEGVDKKFQLLVGRLILRALGATHPVINGKACLDHWSLSPAVM